MLLIVLDVKLYDPFFNSKAILDVDSWRIILSTLQKTEIVFLKIRTELQPGSPYKTKISVIQSEQDKTAIKKLVGQEDEFSINMDLQILSSALDSLFVQSRTYPVILK